MINGWNGNGPSRLTYLNIWFLVGGLFGGDLGMCGLAGIVSLVVDLSASCHESVDSVLEAVSKPPHLSALLR